MLPVRYACQQTVRTVLDAVSCALPSAQMVCAAAKKVIEEKGRKSITVIPLDVTTKLIVTKELVEQITQPEILKRQAQRLRLGPESDYPCCEVGKAMFLADLATFLIKSNMGFRCTKGHTGFLVHDASTLAFLFYPETISLTRGRVKVSTSEDVQGRTHLDMRHLPKAPGLFYTELLSPIDLPA